MRIHLRAPLGWANVALVAVALLHCSSSSDSGSVVCSSINPEAAATTDIDTCYPDSDGITGGTYTIAIAVTDDGFTSTGSDDEGGAEAGVRNIIATQNDAQVTITVVNDGTKPHGFTVGCASVCSAFPTLPEGCSSYACFPAGATIPPIEPGMTGTATFVTPTPDGIIYPFSSGAPGDDSVPGLNQGQWSLM
jgi:hypothetical protein